jgi:hypothetical protein
MFIDTNSSKLGGSLCFKDMNTIIILLRCNISHSYSGYRGGTIYFN